MRLKAILVLLTLFSLSVYFKLFFAGDNTFVLWSDGAIYTIMAKGLYNGDIYSIIHPHWQPLFPLSIYFAYFFTHNWLSAPYLVSLFSGALLLFPISYLLWFITKNQLVTLWGTLYLIVFRPLIAASHSSYSESIFTLFSWTAILFLWTSFTQRSKTKSTLAGLFLGLAYLTKSEGILLLISYLAFFSTYSSYQFFKTKKFSTAFIPKHILWILLGFSILFTGHKLLLNSKYGSYPVLSKFYYLHARPGSAFALSQSGTSTWAQDVWSPWTADPSLDIYRYPENYSERKIYFGRILISNASTRFRRIMNKDFSYLDRYQLILLLLGFLYPFVGKKRKGFNLFVICMFGITLMSLTFFSPAPNSRYYYYMQPFVILLTSLGLALVLDIFTKVTNKFFWKLVLVLLVSIYIYNNNMNIVRFASPDFYSYAQSRGDTTFKRVDKWLLDNDPGQKIISTHEGVGVLSDSIIIYPPFVNTVEELIGYMKIRNAKYIIASNESLHAQLRKLLQDPENRQGLIMVQKDEGYVIYKLD